MPDQVALNRTTNGAAADKDETTKYVYALDLSNSPGCPVHDNGRLRAVIYPDSDDELDEVNHVLTDGDDDEVYDRVELTYYADGSLATRKDQRQSVHEYTYDDYARLIKDKVTALGGADGYIEAITYAYDQLGRKSSVTSYEDSSCTTVANQVKYSYDDGMWGTLSRIDQSHQGACQSGCPAVWYNFDAGVGGGGAAHVGQYLRLDYMSYPNNRGVYFHYAGSGSPSREQKLSLVRTIGDTTGNTVFAAYSYLGARTPVQVTHPAVSGGLTLHYGASGTYAGFDQFGRVVDQKWQTTSSTVRDQFQYQYDHAGNRTSRAVGAGATTLDEAYSYDGLDRLKKVNRGTLAAGTITDANATFAQTWGLDGLGNWPTFAWDDDGGGGDNTVGQNRTHNEVNEISTVRYHGDSSNNAISNWEDPAYDAAGNMTIAPKPGDEVSHHYHMTYDAWNRLVEIRSDDDSTPIAQYRYDGERKRLAKLVPNQTNTSNWDRTDFYYSANWQVLEERVATDVTTANKETPATTVKCQYVWDIRYVDAPVCRDDNMDSGSDNDCMDEGRRHLFHTHDANFNVTALIHGANGNVVERYTYDSYGKSTLRDGSWNAITWDSSYKNAILFCGYYYDAESRLYQVDNRYYHPSTGGWIGRDPKPHPPQTTLYEYCGGRPTTYVDPAGLEGSRIPGPYPQPSGSRYPYPVSAGDPMTQYENEPAYDNRRQDPARAKKQVKDALDALHELHKGRPYYEPAGLSNLFTQTDRFSGSRWLKAQKKCG